jgi:hypothetical protein
MLRSLGIALDVDRICIYEYLGEKKYDKSLEYVAPGCPVPDLQSEELMHDLLHPKLVEAFNSIGYIEFIAEDYEGPEEVLAFMKRFDIKTGILIPIFVDNDY